jgi:hypothetical protein
MCLREKDKKKERWWYITYDPSISCVVTEELYSLSGGKASANLYS